MYTLFQARVQLFDVNSSLDSASEAVSNFEEAIYESNFVMLFSKIKIFLKSLIERSKL